MSESIRANFPDPEIQTVPEPAYSMRWHNFLNRFMLYLAAAVHLLQCGWIFSGKIYYTAEIRRQIYAGIPAMQVIDYALALCLLAAAMLQIFARFRLKKMDWRGVQLLLSAYTILAASQLLYALARFIFAGLSPLNIPVIAQVISYIALLLVNKTYYTHRHSAFGKETK